MFVFLSFRNLTVHNIFRFVLLREVKLVLPRRALHGQGRFFPGLSFFPLPPAVAAELIITSPALRSVSLNHEKTVPNIGQGQGFHFYFQNI